MTKSAQEAALQEFFAECDEIIQRVSQSITTAEGKGYSQEALDSLYRDIHTLKGSSQLFGFNGIGTIAHALEASLDPVRQNKVKLDGQHIDLIFLCLDLITRVVETPSLELNKDPGFQAEMNSLLSKLIECSTAKFENRKDLQRSAQPFDSHEMNDQLTAEVSESSETSVSSDEESLLLGSLTNETKASKGSPETRVEKVVQHKTPAAAPMETTPVKSNNESPKKSGAATMDKPQEDTSSESNSIRVQVNLLDKLMNLVGEMVLTRNQVLQYARISEDSEFLKLTQRLDLVTTELQDNVMRTRMQPIGSVFSKFQRVVRDLNRDLGKSIDLIVSGAETELDKSLIEAIKDPLTHIVRNACDHGIEKPDVRKAAGKPEGGKLNLKAYHEGGQMIIEILDDGGGLDPEKIKNKALQKGIITQEKASSLTDKQSQELIFMPGFSTAEQVSAVSGRGVGMDVVKTNIEKIGGVVEIESIHKQFTRIKLRIPLTLAIVPAMIVSCGKESFAIPQVKLQELLRVDLDEGGKIENLQGQHIFRLRDQLLPLVFCDELMTGKKSILKEKRVFNIVVLNTATSSYGLVVEEIKDTADIVVKPLPPFLKKVEMFSGATIMGDGSVALIVDTQGISDQALGTNKNSRQDKVELRSDESDIPKQTTLTEYLLVKTAGGLFAIPLVLVNRLEEFNSKHFDFSGEEMLVKYRDGLLPLLEVNKILSLGQSQLPSEGGVKPVVVISKNNRLFGLMVDEIHDITVTENEITGHIKPKDGLLGTVVGNDGEVLTIIDTYAVINKAMGIQREEKKKAVRKAKILLAEDTMFFVKQISKCLNGAGFEVDHAPDGEAALKLMKEMGPHYFDLVVSDIEMPKLNGYGLVEKIREEEVFKNLPVIALTTRFREADQKKGYQSGFDKYLEKLQSDELIDTINGLLGARR